MQLKDRTVVVTGGAHGIGRALCRRFAAEGARIAVADLDVTAAAAVAEEIRGIGVSCNVADEQAVRALVERTERDLGPVDLFCSNAGVGFGDGGPLATDADNRKWQLCWDVNVMAHVYAARAVLPGMIARGSGYLLQTASAAGLLNQIGDAAYSTTKHAAVGFAEALAISHAHQGIRVSVLCPQYVATSMVGVPDDTDYSHRPELMSPEQVADVVLAGIEAERFLILPHAEVETYRQRKGQDYERWLNGMRRLRAQFMPDGGALDMNRMTQLPRRE